MKTLIASFDNVEPARFLTSRLEYAGIRARLRNDSWLQRFIFWTHPSAIWKVYVENREYQRARDLLDKWDWNEHILDEAVRCPECHSPRVEYPQYTRKFITPLLVETMIGMGLGVKNYYCQDCQYTWPRKVKVKPQLDVLGFHVRRRKVHLHA